jgi:hypothetical protein
MEHVKRLKGSRIPKRIFCTWKKTYFMTYKNMDWPKKTSVEIKQAIGCNFEVAD